MPFRLEVSAGEGLVRATATGRICVDDVIGHMTRVKRTGASRFPALIDVTRAESVGVSLRDLLSLAHHAHGEFGEGFMAPRAVLVATRRHFEWARVYAALVAGWMSVGVFTDREEALRWLEHRSEQSNQGAVRRVATG